ncbi:M4 family metallopeptidase [Pseudosporangium ferrugineum]|uniref:Zn-dependent metalloprotease n=1 Tax=Pseudosporangium ferrugineum TaxID=439699 RepID=A0A2T0RCM2_9ACTN|nr:M4 family metallopeptidase [Pseudosporangium ferrugineum]PRY18926.1 Zn-dependent metalloprotease [Pseudosporangium ferrugineum]
MRSALALAGITLLAGSGLAVTATSVSAAPPPAPSASLLADAGSALKEHAAAVKGAPQDRYAVYSSKKDAKGNGVVRYTRTHQGLRVYGGDLVIRLEPDGDYAGSSVGLAAPLTLSTTPKVRAAKARTAAKGAFSGKITSVGEPELFIDAGAGTPALAWETVVHGWAKDGQTPSRLHVITDATSNKVRGSFDEIETVEGTGNSIYSGAVSVDTTQTATGFTLVDPDRGNGRTCDLNNGTSTCTTFSDADNVWGTGANSDRASAAVDAHFGAATTFDYFKNVHNRNGIFGNGAGVPSRVHYGNSYVNAFWDGAQMTYGDGDRNNKPLVALDVAGHEMSHGVTENVVPGGLTYSGESGGLNEATSDIFGSMVEFYANTTNDPGDYDIGEKIDIRGTGAPLRFMYNPSLDGSSHSCWSTSTNSVDVHYSSGVANHFFFNLAEGTGATAYGTSPICGSAEPVVGIGREKAENIWFRALDTYFVSNTRYVNTSTPSNTARAYTLSAAADLYGLCGTEYKTVQAAWTAVNVAGSDYCPTGDDFSIAASPTTLPVVPGDTVTTNLTTTVTNGTAETIVLTATGAPAGTTVTFTPPSITAGESATVSIATPETLSTGTYPITLTGTSPSVAHSTTVTLGVHSAEGCWGTNDTDVAIPDNTTVTSRIDLTGCTATPSATSAVEVHIVHTYIGDLVVSLVAPDGTAYTLQSRSGGSTDNIDRTYTVNLAGESADGIWTLRVQDAASIDTGFINSWTLNL